jgi:hypothetical protein
MKDETIPGSTWKGDSLREKRDCEGRCGWKMMEAKRETSREYNTRHNTVFPVHQTVGGEETTTRKRNNREKNKKGDKK